MGFPGTLGADFYDYILGDAITLPMDDQPLYAEKIVQLSDSYLANDDKRPIPGVVSHAGAGLPNRSFVFCCLNNNWKITAPLFAIWMRLLRQVPGSVLWLLEDNEEAANNLRAQARADDINSNRLVFAPRVTPEAHLARHCLADLGHTPV
jgi:protein O-GlcNAc transferase